MLREQLKNSPITTLAEALDGSETGIDVTDGSVFPSVGTFRVIVEDEIMLVTERSSNTLTVVRGAEGTSATSHISGLEITGILTEGGLNQLGKDNGILWGTRPPLNSITDASGTVLDSSDFTQVNFTNAAAYDDGGTILIEHALQGGVEDVAALVIAAPGTPYTVIAAFQTLFITSQNTAIPNAGVVFRKSSDGKLHTLSINWRLNTSADEYGPMWSSYKFDDPSTFSSSFKTRKHYTFNGDLFWMKLEDDGTDLTFSFSMDGIHWVEVGTEPRTTFMSGGPDQVGFYINNPNNGIPIQSRLVHWSMG